MSKPNLKKSLFSSIRNNFIAGIVVLIPIGFTYATYGALTITAVTLFGIFEYNQIPNLYGTIGLILIISGVILLNLFGKLK